MKDLEIYGSQEEGVTIQPAFRQGCFYITALFSGDNDQDWAATWVYIYRFDSAGQEWVRTPVFEASDLGEYEEADIQAIFTLAERHYQRAAADPDVAEKESSIVWEPVFCDDCGELLPTEDEQYPVESLPVNIESANAGESAVLCQDCRQRIKKEGEEACPASPSS